MRFKHIFLFLIVISSEFASAAFPEDCIPKDQLTAEDEEFGYRFVDNILQMTFDFGGSKYVLTRKGQFSVLNGKEHISKALSEMASGFESYESFYHNNVALIKAGKDDFEGAIFKIYVLDLQKFDVKSDLQMCINDDDEFFLYKKNLYYYCMRDCSSEGYVYRLNEKEKKFEKVQDLSLCSKEKRTQKIKFMSPLIKRTKNPKGKEYETSNFKIRIC